MKANLTVIDGCPFCGSRLMPLRLNFQRGAYEIVGLLICRGCEEQFRTGWAMPLYRN